MSTPDQGYGDCVFTLLLGHPNSLVGGALASVLSAAPDLQVVAELDQGDAVPMLAARERAQIAVLAADLPGSTSVGELCRTLQRELPRCRPLVLLERDSSPTLARSLIALTPWLGLVATDTGPTDLVSAVRRLGRGERVLDNGFAEAAQAGRTNPLTQRERDILRLTRYGAPPKEIATKLGMKVGTVRNHLIRTVIKTGARTRLEATHLAQEAGWI